MSIRPAPKHTTIHEEWWLDKKREATQRAELQARLVPVRATYRAASFHRQAEMLAQINAFITDAER